jgi:mono/diheme cytochrome c family protein
MRLLLKILGIGLFLLLIVVTGGLAYLLLALPNASAAPVLHIQPTPARIERGRYLTQHVAACVACHSERDFTQFSAPVPAGTEGVGHAWRRNDGMPGNYWAINLTPVGLGRWTDGEIVRAITTGISRDGHALFPLMPYLKYRIMPIEDVYAMVAYLRSLPPRQPAEKNVPAREVDFPLDLIIRTMPRPAEPARVDPADRVAYGRYLTQVAACAVCHSPAGERDEADLSGNQAFPLPGGGVVRSANITPDQTTGIGAWSEAQFIARFKAYENPAPDLLALKSPRHNTEMPWTAYGGMTPDDLGAIYAYLRTVKPIAQKVQTFEP